MWVGQSRAAGGAKGNRASACKTGARVRAAPDRILVLALLVAGPAQFDAG